jgi:hypothetical protein
MKRKILSLGHQILKGRFNMKNLFFFSVFFFLLAVLGSCSTDVNMYADYKDVAIVYAMIDPRADTNYVKITRAFCGSNDEPINANEVALIADSSNYPCKLEARIVELKSLNGGAYEPTGNVFWLDTMTLHNKDYGTFYAPDQKIYYTTERFNTDKEGTRYKYRLIVVKPNGDTLTAVTSMVGSQEFRILSSSTNFQLAPTNELGKITFKADGRASLYDVKIQFNYREQHAGQAMTKKKVFRSFGTKPIEEFERVEGTPDCYFLECSKNWLFVALRNAIGADTVVNANHPNVVRYIDDFVVSISAGGHELYYYYAATQAQLNSPISLVSTYTNIDGGSGLFSSRITISKTLKISASTKRDLFSVVSWGFKED